MEPSRWERSVYENSLLLKHIKKRLLCPSPMLSKVVSSAAERGDSCLEKVLHWDTNQLECQWPELRTLTPARREAGQLSPFRGRRGGLDLWGLPCASIKDPLLIDQVGWAPFQDMTGMDWLYQTAGPVWGGGFSFFLAKQETKHWWMHDFNTLLTRGFLQKLMPVAGDLLCKWILIQSSQKRSG